MAKRTDPTVINLPAIKRACKSCSVHDLCLPLGVNRCDLELLEKIVRQRRPLQRSEHLYRPGDNLACIYVVRAGSMKTYMVTSEGQERIVGFHLPGELLGLDAIGEGVHPCAARALETTSVCEIPFFRLEALALEVPGLQRQLLRLMSRSLQTDENFMMLLSKKASDERLAAFLLSLSTRFHERGYSQLEFNLNMSRHDIANYLGLAVETVSRLFTRFQNAGLLTVRRKLVAIHDLNGVRKVANLQDRIGLDQFGCR